MVKVNRDTIADVKAAREWSALEQAMLDACATGEEACLAGRDGLPEDQGDPDRRIRPALIRYLLRGGCAGDGGMRPHAKGVRVWGGWIDGRLDLEVVRSDLDLVLGFCLFNDSVDMRDAQLGGLYLDGSRMAAGLDLQRLQTATEVSLRYEFYCAGQVNLCGAKIGGSLDCTAGKFLNAGGIAIHADKVQIGASVSLRDKFRAEGEVNLVGAKIIRSLDCSGGQFINFDPMAIDIFKRVALNASQARIGGGLFLRHGCRAEGEVNLAGVQITGQLDCVGGQFINAGSRAISADNARIGACAFLREGFQAEGIIDFVRAEISGNLRIENAVLDGGFDAEAMKVGAGFFWQNVRGSRSFVDLTEAHVGSLRDDRVSWDGIEKTKLCGFRYDRIESAMSVGDRLKWVAQKEERDLVVPEKLNQFTKDRLAGKKLFDPQPYSQLANVLTGMGNRAGAARVLENREGRLRQADFWRSVARMADSVWPFFRLLPAMLGQIWDWLLYLLFGYGHRPARVFYTLIPLWVGVAWLYWHVYTFGQMAPNSDVVLNSRDWLDAVAQGARDGVPALHVWTGVGDYQDKPSYIDYETFSAVLYAADLFIPLDAIGQEGAWAPSHDRGFWGQVGYWARFPIQLAGWVITAVGAAVVTGLVGRKE